MKRPERYGRPDPEVLDDTPVAMPLSACRPPNLTEQIAKMVRAAIQEERQDEMETFEEANDFEEEDPEAIDLSPYELTPMQAEYDPADGDPMQMEPSAEPASSTGEGPDPYVHEPSEPSKSADAPASSMPSGEAPREE